ncbi:CHAT domain-containing protein [Rhodocollybia butyracea]|uniref:CHAT domain-containing protein n=1 Tax=Rhodocollybia butyracea TaxID=206335 RepID=A0A9P5PFQ6_9AGAR|nr:CHAT domain-containing protein [Rhodocollybia butyracea]
MNSSSENLKAIDTKIALARATLLRYPVGHPEHASSLSDLGVGLRSRFKLTGHLEDLEESIQLNQEALLLHPMGHPEHASSLSNLSRGLRRRFKLTGHLEDLQKFLQLNQEVLLLCPVGHPDRGPSLSSLSSALRNRFRRTGHLEDLNRCIELDQEALLLRPMGHHKRALSLNNLSAGLYHRFQQTGHLEDLDRCIELDQEALLLRPAGHPGRASSLMGLGSSFRNRFRRTGHLEDLDKCIQLDYEALLLRPVGHPERASSLNNLGLGLQSRFQLTGHLKDLEKFIQLNEEALVLYPIGYLDRPFPLNNLSIGLRERFQLTSHIEDLHESIKLGQEALQLRPVGHWTRASSLQNLSLGLQSRFQLTGHLDDLEELIKLAQEALLLCPLGHPEHASSLNILSVGLWNRFQQASYKEDLTECLLASKQAANDLYSPVSDCLKAVKNWVEFTLPHHDLAQSNLDAYITGLSFISRSLSMMPILALQYQHLLSVIKLPEFVSDGASQAIQLGQPVLAVEIIEQGRGFLWSELRGLRMPMDRLQALEPSLANDLMQINHQLEILSTKNSVKPCPDLLLQAGAHQHPREVDMDSFGCNLSEKRHLLNAQRDIVGKIRKIPGFETFLGRKLFGELQSAAKHGPVIVVNCSRHRSDVLIILEQDSPVLIPMVKGFYEATKTLAQRLTEARIDIKVAPKRYNHVLRATLQDLWDLVVSPVVSKLRELQIPEMSRIFWCPTSILSTLPLHAAGPVSPGTKKFLPDLYISSYTPTLTALITAFTTCKSSSKLPRLLVAGQYDNSLRNTKEEMKEVVQYKKRITVTSLEGASATKNAVAKTLVDHEWLHIASHGTLVPKEPFGSYFSLACGSRFTLLDIIRLNLPNATFAFLSACHTAEQSVDSVHNEVIHLAAAMQFCGFRSVVGTMWEMADVDGPEMVKDFYSSVFSNLDEDPSRCNEVGVQARALADAIKKMRARKGVTLERWVNFVHIGA